MGNISKLQVTRSTSVLHLREARVSPHYGEATVSQSLPVAPGVTSSSHCSVFSRTQE